MKGAIFFISKYGSTAQYANWIGKATGLPVRCVTNSNVDPMAYDFLIIASPVIYYKLLIDDWVRQNIAEIGDKPVIMVSVSSASPGANLDGWIRNSLPPDLVSRMKHVALRGRLMPRDLTWYDRVMLLIGVMKKRYPVALKKELEGFDFVDKSSIGPVVDLVRRLQTLKEIPNPDLMM